MSKLKKIVSIILIVTMLMTVAPVSTFASAYTDYTYGTAPTYEYTEYYVDTTATDNVIRVGADGNAFLPGTKIYSATPSGIPYFGETDPTFAASAYAGEKALADYPDIVVRFVGRKPDKVDDPTHSSANNEYADIKLNKVSNGTQITVDGKTAWEYVWKITGGEATIGADIIWTVNYYFDTDLDSNGNKITYTTYAYQHVEKILMQSGYTVIARRGSAFRPNNFMSYAITVQGKNVYSNGFHGDKDWSRGYLNYIKGSWDTGNEAILGMGQSTEGDWSTDQNAFGYRDDTNGTMVSYYNDTGSSGNFGDSVMLPLNGNRPWTKAYMDIRRDGGNIENINLRQVMISGESSRNKYHGFHSQWVKTSNVNNPSSWGSVTQPSGFLPKEVVLDSGTVHSVDGVTNKGDTELLDNAGNWMMVKFKGTLGVGTYNYAIVTMPWSSSDISSGKNVWGTAGMSITFEVFNTTDLYNVYRGILKGTGSYSTTLHGSTTVNFNKGINPRSEMYSNGWSDFEAAMQKAGRILQTPDTNQTEVNAATSNLISAYNNLTTVFASPTVNVKVNHYITGTTTEVAPAQYITNSDGSYAAVPVGATAKGYALEKIDGYALDGTYNVKSLTIDGKKNPAEITFYYKPSTYSIIINTNNPSVDAQVRYDGIAYNQYVTTSDAYSAMGTKEYYVLDGFYYDSAFKEKVDDHFYMPASNLTLYAKWVTAPVNLYVDPQISGVAPILVGSVTPNEDTSVAVQMNKPATDPEVDGYLFTGYYADAGLTTALEWPQEFFLGDSDRTVYGRFVDVNGKIIFESNGGSAVADMPFTANSTVIAAPADPVREGYIFKGWYTDNTFATPITWGVTMPNNTGFVAYAKWEAEMHSISFNLNNANPTPYDTQSITPRTGYSDTVIPADRIPAAPRRFGYVFDRWMYNDGTGYKTYNFKTYPKKDIELVAQWRGVTDSAFIGIEGYEKLSGEYKTLYDANTNPDGAKIQAGDVVTFRMTSYANFYVGSTLFVFMYDKDFFEIVPGTATMFKLNGNNEYVSGIDATFTEVTDSSLLEARWPADLAAEMSDYAAMQIAIDPTVATDNYDAAPMKDGEWLVEFQLKVKDNATGSGKVYMDNAWTRSDENPMGTMFYGWAEKGDAVFDTINDIVKPDLESATVTVVLDETAPVETTVVLNAAPGAFADGAATKTYKGRAETEIIGYTEPTRLGYELTGWVNADETSDYTTWAEGYYAKEGYGDTVTFNAVWNPLLYAADFYMEIGGAHFDQVDAYYGETVTAPSKLPSKQGYDFAGWSTDGENVLADLGIMDTTEGKKYYAVWTPADDTPFTVEIYVLAEGQNAAETYEYTGTTGSTVKVVREADVPATPEAGVTYVTIESIEEDLEYYILDADDANNASVTGIIAADGSLVLKLYFEGKPVTVTFDADGGKFSNGEGQYLSIGGFNESIVPPEEIPVKYGYDFVEWIDFDTSFTYYEDEAFYASWTPSLTNIQFIADGVQIGALVETEFGKVPKAPTAPAKVGWEFKGWKETADGTTYITTLPAVDVINDETTGIAKTYYAHYEQTAINVIYKVDGVVKYTDKYFAGAEVIIRAAEENKTGYVFSGWKRADGSDATNFTMGQEEVIISGSFIAKEIGIVFNANGGAFADGEETTVNTTFNTAINLPAAPTRAGYTFKGWATAADATSGSTSLGTLTAESGKYYAVWEANTVEYYIDIYVMDTAGAYQIEDTITESAKVDSEVTYTAAARDGFKVSAESVLTGTVPAEGEALRLVVKYERNKWNLILTMDGETVDTIPYYYEQAVAEPAEPSKPGYSFGGWTPDVPGTMPNKDVTLIATMTPNNYNVIYDYKGGTYQGAATTTLSKTFGTVIPNEIQTDAIVYEGHTFSHWINAATGEVVEFTASTPVVPIDGITFEAVYTVNKYTVTYSNNGATVAEILVPYGTTLADIKANYAPAADLKPTLSGHTFIDWNWSAIGETMPARNIMILAQWQANTYKISFNENGGTEVTDIEVTFNTPTNFSGVTTREGYTFNYWYLDDENTQFSIPFDMPALDELYGSSEITLNAKWTVKSYTITFDSKGGSAVDSITANYGEEISVPANPELKGYTFDYWYLNDSSVPFEFGSTMPALDTLYGAYEIKLNAKWTVKTITITFDSNGGSDVAPITLEYGKYIENRPADPTRTGYSFTGWTLDGQEYIIPEYMDHGEDVTVVANWEKNKYTITFNSNGGTAVDKIEALYEEDITAKLPLAENMKKQGYVFAGWLKNGAAYELPATMPAENIRLEAKWNAADDTAYIVNVYYMNTEGVYSSEPDEQIPGSGTTGELATYAPETKEGFTANEGMSTLSKTIEADGSTVLEVYYDRNEHNVTFSNTYDAAYNGDTSGIYYYDSIVIAPSNEPVREGYTFGGWYTDINDESTKLAADGAKVPDSAVTYEAKWNVNEYTVTYFADGVQVAQDTFNYDEAVTKNAVVPTKTGYTFAYWYETNEAVEFAFGEAMPARDIILTAAWTANDVSVIYKFDGDVPAEAAKPADKSDAHIGDVIDLTAPAAVYGFTFNGWTVEGADQNAEGKYVVDTRVVTVTGNWTRNSYTITFDSKGGSDVADITEEYMTVVANPTAPTKTGHTFNKWVVAGTTTEYDFAAPLTADVALEAIWDTNTYTITYVAGEGATEVPAKDYLFGATTAAPSDPSKLGYTFNYWYETDANVEFVFGEAMPARDITLNASWTANNVSITYTFNGNVPESAVKPADKADAHIGDVINVDEPAAVAGYTFNGWTVNGADMNENGEYVVDTRAVTVSGNWTINSYTVKFTDYNDAVLSEGTFAYNTEIAIKPATDPARVGYTFVGYYATVDGAEVKFEDGAKVPAADVTYVAKYEINSYNLTFTANGTELYNGEVEYGKDLASYVPAYSDVPAKAGYRFAGWALATDPATAVSVAKQMPASDLSYVAVYEPGVYNVYYYVKVIDGDDATTDSFKLVTTSRVEFGSVIANSVNYKTPAGFEFSGWYKDEALNNKLEDGETMSGGKLSLYATETAIAYDAIFDANGGKFADGETSKAVSTIFETEIVAPAAPEKVGYNFMGWAPTVGIMDTVGGKEFKAQWQAIEGAFTVTYYVDGEEYEVFALAADDSLDIPADPDKKGYEFLGWAPASVAEPTADDVVDLKDMVMPAENLEYNAVFKAVSATATFYKFNDTDRGPAYNTESIGYAVYVEEGYIFGETFEVPAAPALVNTAGQSIDAYYTFLHWVDDEGNTYEAGEVIEMKGEINFYPVYERVTVKLVAADGATTVIERGTAADYADWYVYGLAEGLDDSDNILDIYLDVEGDGYYTVEYVSKTAVGTGAKIRVYDNFDTTKTAEEFYIIIFGDLNGDGRVRSADTTLLRNEVAMGGWTDDYLFKAADLNGDGNLRSADTNLLQRAVAGAIVINQVTGLTE